MKLLECESFEALNCALEFDIGRWRKIVGRVECYSCKMVGCDKKLFRSMHAQPGTSPNDLQALSPPPDRFRLPSFSGSPLSNSPLVNNQGLSQSYSDAEGNRETAEWTDAVSRRTLFYLIGTLNASFHPDYDFSEARSDEFCRERTHEDVMNAVDNCFRSAEADQTYSELRAPLWAAIDREINLNSCEIYSCNPDCDPFDDDGLLWFFNYFFYNRKLKRIVLFKCRAFTTGEEQPEFPMEEQKYGHSLGFEEEEFGL